METKIKNSHYQWMPIFWTEKFLSSILFLLKLRNGSNYRLDQKCSKFPKKKLLNHLNEAKEDFFGEIFCEGYVFMKWFLITKVYSDMILSEPSLDRNLLVLIKKSVIIHEMKESLLIK